MATNPRRTRTRGAPEQSAAQMIQSDQTEIDSALADVIPVYQRRPVTEYVGITDIVPYEWNPRKNEAAVAAVKASIQSFGFLVPCVIDANNVLVAGHTRVEASKLLGITDVPCIRADFLTPEQVNAFRLIDNKVAEKAEWDFDLLAGEIAKFANLGLDLTEYGWSQEELDCLSDLVAPDCLNPASLMQAQTDDPEAEAVQAQRRAPIQARIVIGEIVLFVTSQQYRHWADGIRALCEFDEGRIAAEVKRRLGILE